MEIKRIIEAAGGPSKLGKSLGLSHSSVSCWKRVPAAHVPAVSKITAIGRHLLRPDLWEPPEMVGEPHVTPTDELGDQSVSVGRAA